MLPFSIEMQEDIIRKAFIIFKYESILLIPDPVTCKRGILSTDLWRDILIIYNVQRVIFSSFPAVRLNI